MKYIDYEEIFDLLPKKARIVLSHAAAIPNKVLDYLVDKASKIDYYEFIHMIPFGNIPYCVSDFEYDNIKHNSLFVGRQTQEFVNNGISDYTPINFSMVPKYLEEIQPEVCILQVSKTINSRVSLGISVDYGLQAFKSSKLRIAIQNSKMPYTFGDGEIHINEFDYIVRDDFELHTLVEQVDKRSDVYDLIANSIANLINNGSTLQLGIGAIPNYVLKKLSSKSNLGIHSEMISDNIIDLIESGVINNLNKVIDKGFITATFALGSKRLYDYINLNPKFKFRTVDFVNNPNIISQNPASISINSALEIDLSGQVNAEKLNGYQISGVGGQLDFVRGSRMSLNGKSIIAMPSTNSDSTISRIRSKIPENNIITTTRNDVDYVCTEFGLVKLSGETLTKRRDLLISIAHPKFRDDLYKGYI